MELSKEALEKIDQLIPKYPQKRSAALPLLHIVQEEKGFISREAMEWIAKKLDLQPINIFELVTFYPMLRQEKAGRKHIKVCRTLSCALRGSHVVCSKLQEALDCPLNKTTEDGEYTIEFVECLASCGTAPVVQVNDVLHENVKPEKVEEFVKQLRGENPSYEALESTGEAESERINYE